jgi:hypothetical protein
MAIPKFDVSDEKNPRRRKLYAALYEIFSLGIQRTPKKNIVLVSLWSAVLETALLPTAMIFKFAEVAIIVVAWLFFSNQSGAFSALADLLLALALLGLFFKDLKAYILKVSAYLFNAVTGGEIFKAICEGRREGNLKSEYLFKTEMFQDIIGTYANILPQPYRQDYEHLISLYSKINERKWGKAFGNALDENLEDILEKGYKPGEISETENEKKARILEEEKQGLREG